MKRRDIGVGLIGFGTIGAGVVGTLAGKRGVIRKNLGFGLKLLKIADVDIETDRGVRVAPKMLTTDYREVSRNPDISIAIELIGGTDPAREIVLDCLRNGKHVVTANKELISKHGPELMREARRNGVCLLFEASVGGGIPILSPLLSCLRANRIRKVVGIVNGTTNYILSRMEQEGTEFEAALREAQERGYAEADPTNDVDGLDPMYKIAILTAVAFGRHVPVGEIPCEGIRHITRRDMCYAMELGYRIKLVAVSQDENGEQDVRVHPTLLPLSHPLASVHGVLNAVYIEGEPVGELMFVGEGAGPDATSSAVVGDVIELAEGRAQLLNPKRNFFEKVSLVPAARRESAFYMRMIAEDRPNVLAEITAILGARKVSIASVVQKAVIGDGAEIVWLTHPTREKGLRDAVREIMRLDCVRDIPAVINVMD
ncbi:MAG: homoserine dehydrogenase [bacterium]